MSIAKKVLSLLLTLVLCLSVGGCGKTPPPNTDTDESYVSERELAENDSKIQNL